MESRATRWELKGLKVVASGGGTPEGGCSTTEAIGENAEEIDGKDEGDQELTTVWSRVMY